MKIADSTENNRLTNDEFMTITRTIYGIDVKTKSTREAKLNLLPLSARMAGNKAGIVEAIGNLLTKLPRNQLLELEKIALRWAKNYHLRKSLISDPIVDICRTLNDYIYDNCGLEVLQKSESCYRSYLFDKCMMTTTKYFRNVNYDITFFPGEIELNSMTTQLKQKGMNDGRYKYNADGTLVANDLSAIEILLTEVSSGYGFNENGKVSFDHHKAMFGMLSMIRSVAQVYNKASFNTFTKLKIHFLHVHGDSVRHWSMSTQGPGLYIMTKEQRVKVPISFFDKDISVLPFICFFKTLATACKETLSVLKELEQEHKTVLRSNDMNPRNLCDIINSMIIRLNEGKHTSIVAEHCPMSLPSSPIHS
ncbi:unnamed protein product [Mucor hiemalis]